MISHHPGSISNQRCESFADGRLGVVVVVQPLAGGHEGEPLQVAGVVVVGPATEVVGDRVHRGGASEVDVDVDEGCEQTDPPPGNRAQGGDPEAEADHGVVVEQAVEPGGWQVTGVSLDGARVPCLAAVHRHVHHLHLDPAIQYRGVRITLDIGEGVVFPVDGDPLPRPNPRGHPHHEPEDLLGWRPQRQGAVGQRSMEVHGGRHVGDQRNGDAEENGTEHGSHRLKISGSTYR